MIRALAIIAMCVALTGCGAFWGMVASGAVGAALSPVVQPAVDRGLDAVGLDWVDPAGTDAVKEKK